METPKWKPPTFNALGVIVVIPKPHQEIDRDLLRAHVVDLDAAMPWDSTPMRQAPSVIYRDNKDRFGPEYKITFGPGRLLTTSQLQAYERYALCLAYGLKKVGLPEVLEVSGGVEYRSTYAIMP